MTACLLRPEGTAIWTLGAGRSEVTGTFSTLRIDLGWGLCREFVASNLGTFVRLPDLFHGYIEFILGKRHAQLELARSLKEARKFGLES